MHQLISHTPPLLNETEAAQVLAISPKTLRRWRWAGKGPYFLKIEGAVRYDSIDLAAFVQASRRQSTSDPGKGPPKWEAP